jgi:cytochrome P450
MIVENKSTSLPRTPGMFPPGPTAGELQGVALAQPRGVLPFFERLVSEFGDMVTFEILGHRVFLFNEPDAVRQLLISCHVSTTKGPGLGRTKVLLGNGLLTSEGELHRKQRRVVAPAFHARQIESYVGTMVTCAREVILKDDWADGSEIDIASELQRLTLNIIAKVMFGIDLGERSRAVGESLNQIFDLQRKTLGLSWGLKFARLFAFLPANHKFLEACQRLEDTVEKIIHERLDTGETTRNDLLAMLIAGSDQIDDAAKRQIRDEAMTMLIAGHETTANALTWSLHLLMQHPDVAATLRAEVDAQLAGNRVPALAEIEHLEYTERVFRETMRLYPPAWIVGRETLETVEIAGWTVPRGSLCVVSQYLIHRDPRYYPDPLRFDPDRWIVDKISERSKYSYFPFGAGPRQCAGEHFAWTEGVLLLALICRHWDFTPVETTQSPQPFASITLRVKNGLRIRLSKRTSDVISAAAAR